MVDMAYEVLARKYRPTQFDEIVGQEHVVGALSHALTKNRLHHAYFFAGTRGVGKTTLARLLARCLNCEQGVSAQPCGACASCEQISQGRFIDLMEIDAASHTGVDRIRELLDNTLYAPVQGRYKVYLIDEVHMLSKQAFNALLITLEEPPAYVKFVLATTDPSKVPVTILSRCLQFHLHNLSPELIASHLEQVLTQEDVGFEAEGLSYLAKAANGSVRDALSLADQATAFGGGTIQAAQVVEMLGLTSERLTGELLQAIADDDVAGLLQLVDESLRGGADVDALLSALATMAHQIGLLQVVPGLELVSAVDPEQINRLAKQLSAEAVQLYYQAALQGRKDLSFAPDQATGLQMTLLRMLAFRPLFGVAGQKPKPQPMQASASPPPASPPPPTPPPPKAPPPTPAPAKAPVDYLMTPEAGARQKEANQEIANDSFVKKIQKQFSATMIQGSIRPQTSKDPSPDGP